MGRAEALLYDVLLSNSWETQDVMVDLSLCYPGVSAPLSRIILRQSYSVHHLYTILFHLLFINSSSPDLTVKLLVLVQHVVKVSKPASMHY